MMPSLSPLISSRLTDTVLSNLRLVIVNPCACKLYTWRGPIHSRNYRNGPIQPKVSSRPILGMVMAILSLWVGACR